MIKNLNLHKLNFKHFYFISVCTIFLFVSEGNNVISFLHFNYSKIILLLSVFLLVSFIILISRRKIYFDFISSLLFLRLVLYLVPLSYLSSVDSYWGNYFAVVGSFFAYLICSQSHQLDIAKSINKISFMFYVIICIQVIYAYAYINNEYIVAAIGLFKYYLVTPIGASNYIACIILPLLIYILYSTLNNKIKIISVILGLCALTMIQSKNAILILIIFFVYKLISKYIGIIIKSKGSSEYRMPIILISAALILFITLGSFFVFRYFLYKWHMGISINSYSIYELLNALTSNRLNTYSSEILRWSEHVFFGNGVSYQDGFARSHNWIIELLVQSGIIGFMVFLSALAIWFIKIIKHKDQFVTSVFCFVVIVLMQGLAEVSLFTYAVDILLWSYMGLCISHINYMSSLYSVKKNNHIQIYTKHY